MDCHNLLKLSEMLYFALKIVSWSEWAYESNLGQAGYRAVSHFYALNLRVAETCGMAVCTSSGARSERFLQLNVEDKKRYIAKLSLIDGID